MRILLNIRIPHEPFNAYVRDGTIGALMERILAEMKPEAAYFTQSYQLKPQRLVNTGLSG